MKFKKLAALFMGITVMVTAAACSSKQDLTITETTSSAGQSTESTTEAAKDALTNKVKINVGSLKGVTSMGLVSLMDKNEMGEAVNDYNFTMVTGADELVASMVKGDIDIALIPANLASVLVNKNEGSIQVININMLGVLNLIVNGDSVKSIDDLSGKTVYLTGKGLVPEFSFRYILDKCGLTDKVTLEFKSEPTEVVSILTETEGAIGLLPQPFATASLMKNDKLKVALNLSEEWDKVSGGVSSLITGVTVVRSDFLKEHQNEISKYQEEYKASVDFANSNPKEASVLIEKYDIVKAPIAEKALPECNITFITGNDMKTRLEGYLQVLYDQNPESVGGKMPEDSLYYLGK